LIVIEYYHDIEIKNN